MPGEESPYTGGFSECTLIGDDYKRLCCEFEELKRAGKIVVEAAGSQNPCTAHHWTVLKLVFLKMYVRDVYTPIIGRRYPYMVFIDLFAGRGLNAYENASFYIPGSTLIAWFYATYPFDKLYAVGYNKPRDNPEYIWLKRRLERFIPRRRLKLLIGDANKKVDDIARDLIYTRDEVKEELGGGLHYLAFIDPNSHEIHWSTIKKLIELEKEGISGDFIILLQARMIARVMGNIRSGKKKYHKASQELNLFFGTEEWRDFLNVKKGLEQRILDLYIGRLRKLKSKALIERIEIELMREDIHYYLIYVTRETRGGSPYLDTVRWLESFAERVDKKTTVDNAIKDVLGIGTIKIIDFVRAQSGIS
ncbi:MAG: three-Cys-motif partner protein TcmP [Desulfurococcales archaeon]|nr:three-Cys-motif partner protein TcmP [Desulfurococcales archaeon]